MLLNGGYLSRNGPALLFLLPLVVYLGLNSAGGSWKDFRIVFGIWKISYFYSRDIPSTLARTGGITFQPNVI